MPAQISDGHIQVRYNLGGANKVLRVSSVTVADAEPRSITVSRAQDSLEIVVNGSHLARTSSSASAGSGGNTTLSVQPGHLFLGGEVDVATGDLMSGFKGCLRGVKLDMVELPLSQDGSTTFRVLKFPPGGAIPGCPLLSVGEREQPNVYIYAGMGAIIGGLLLISFVFITTCVIVGFFWRKKHDDFEPNRSRPGSPRNFGFTYRGPDEIIDQKFQPSDTFELQDINYQSDHTRSPSSLSQNGEATGNFSHSGSTFQKPTHFTSVSIEPSHSRQESRVSEESSVKNISYLHSTPLGSDHEDGPRRPQSARSSLGHFSVYSDDSLQGIGSEHQRKVLDMRRRVEKADMAFEESFVVDELTHFSIEGPFEPLGSIGSLHDIILAGKVQQRPVKQNIPTPGLTYEPSAAPSTKIGHTRQQHPTSSVQQTGQPVEYTTPQITTANGIILQKQPSPTKKKAVQTHYPEVKKGNSSTRKPTSPTKTNPLTPSGQKLKMEKKHNRERENPLLQDMKTQGHLHNQRQLQQSSKAPFSQSQFSSPQPPKFEKTHSSAAKLQSKKWEVSIYEGKGSGDLENQSQTEEGKGHLENGHLEKGHNKQLRRSARRSGRHVRKGSVENILEKFNNITMAGGFSQDNKETTEVL